MSFRSTISRHELDRRRNAKKPNEAEIKQAAQEFPDNPMKAAMRAIELASERHRRERAAA